MASSCRGVQLLCSLALNNPIHASFSTTGLRTTTPQASRSAALVHSTGKAIEVLESTTHLFVPRTTRRLVYHVGYCNTRRRSSEARASVEDSSSSSSSQRAAALVVGEDAAVFDPSNQKTSSWLLFTLILGVSLTALYVLWIDPNTGYGGAFIDAVSSVSSSHEVVILIILFIFALVHSGLASLRGEGEKLVGERAYRVLYAVLSLPLAVSAVVYFINHRSDGLQLWQVQTVPGVHELVWVVSFVSFFFLYPSTFNLLEVAAVDKPKMRMWETGIMRITRHPQMVGQVLWCFAHTLWIGSSFTLATSLGLVAHHLFGVWHGDKRLAERYGESFQQLKQRTSVIPFAAIIDGRQKLPADYYKEFLRLPYFVVAGFTVGAYLSQPLLQSASRYLNW
ncbi:unnamed protein product [Sphagnum troendelagicum]|uniref:NnrU domain-containing protein n=1 Tax=Sphagnum troendelagicum TaxID=128251 RepID=A0ABP0TBB0_9BRYO